MDRKQLTQASARVALAAYLHDLGKFAERAAIEQAAVKDANGVSLKDAHVQQYCPNFNGNYSHIHAAFTAIAMDVIERFLPDIKAGNCSPFDSWANPDALREGDSLINAAAMHHKPESFLQWIVAAGDRLASGFERSEFEDYNRAEEVGATSRNYKQARQLVLFEAIRLQNKASATYEYRYPLQPLSPVSIFPQATKQVEPGDNKAATAQYRAHWEDFISSLQNASGASAIPNQHKNSMPLWLDHFDTLWQTYAHCIPAATAGRVDGKFIAIPADVSLYDHSRTAAALATALWRYHEHNDTCGTEHIGDLKQDAWAQNDQEKFLLIQGDMFGIQDFILSSGGSSQKFAAKLLRGRSFYIALLTECAALAILDELGLPPTSQVVNAAGKFLILADNTQATQQAIERVRQRIDAWFLQHTQGRAGLGLALSAACSKDFRRKQHGGSPFGELMAKMFRQLETIKLQRLNLCDDAPTVFDSFLDTFDSDLGVCNIDGLSPATSEQDGVAMGALSRDQINIGGWLASKRLNRVLLTRNRLEQQSCRLNTAIFGYHVTFATGEDSSGKFGSLAATDQLLRAWDIALPDAAGDRPLWNGYARRNINTYAPAFTQADWHTSAKYAQDLEQMDLSDFAGTVLKPLDMIACEDRTPDAQMENWQGIVALQALKGDVDNLGQVFQSGLEQPSFARMAAMSRQMNNFFAVYLPHLCQTRFPNCYVVFAGGDDFYLVGPWLSQIKLARQMRKDFAAYVAHNPEIHFSAGLFMVQPGVPIRQLGEAAEEALEQAKRYTSAQGISKNAVSCYGETVDWDTFETLLDCDDEIADSAFSTSFIYGLLELAEMAGSETSSNPHPEDALWRSRLSYRVARTLERQFKRNDGESTDAFQNRRREAVATLCSKLAIRLGNHRRAYTIPLFNHLYRLRN
jgi:CRISPR-associated protein Csm1